MKTVYKIVIFISVTAFIIFVFIMNRFAKGVRQDVLQKRNEIKLDSIMLNDSTHIIIENVTYDENFTYRKEHYSNKYEKVDMMEFIDNSSRYNNKLIEIEGVYYGNRNETAIYSKSKKDRIWLSFTNDLIDDNGGSLYESNKVFSMNEVEVIIRGKYDMNKKGNLSMYKGTIYDIVYFSTE